jgi:hypothetical protein
VVARLKQIAGLIVEEDAWLSVERSMTKLRENRSLWLENWVELS